MRYSVVALGALVVVLGCDRPSAPAPAGSSSSSPQAAISAAPPPELPSPEEIARRRKEHDCRLLIRAAGERQAEIRKATQRIANNGGAAEIEALAMAFDDAVAALSGLSLGDAELVRLSREYQQTMQEMASMARSMASNARRSSVEGMEKAQAQMGDAEAKEAALVRRINGACGGDRAR